MVLIILFLFQTQNKYTKTKVEQEAINNNPSSNENNVEEKIPRSLLAKYFTNHHKMIYLEQRLHTIDQEKGVLL